MFLLKSDLYDFWQIHVLFKLFIYNLHTHDAHVRIYYMYDSDPSAFTEDCKRAKRLNVHYCNIIKMTVFPPSIFMNRAQSL